MQNLNVASNNVAQLLEGAIWDTGIEAAIEEEFWIAEKEEDWHEDPALPQQSFCLTTTGDHGTKCLHLSVKNQIHITRSNAEIRRENNIAKDRTDAENQQIRQIHQKIQGHIRFSFLGLTPSLSLATRGIQAKVHWICGLKFANRGPRKNWSRG